jgi:hypothetical protein
MRPTGHGKAEADQRANGTFLAALGISVGVINAPPFLLF